jgi:uncharacterized protein (TIGR02646 family)
LRYISRERIVPPEGWQKKAEKALAEIALISDPEERKRAINRKSKIWKELKEMLLQCSHDKCWYCESKVTHVAPGDVDHWRPKNAVEECPDHPGYWWKAFDWDNFRFSCNNCNRHNTDTENNHTGGKEAHFALWDESRRVRDSSGDIRLEEPLLLDPVRASDPPLLTFDEDGMARPSRTEQQSPKAYKRAHYSIEVYHLNRSKLKNRRQFYVCNKVKALIQEGEDCLAMEKGENSSAARESYNKVVERLYEMVRPEEEYSAAAKAVLYTYRNLEWVDELCRNL